MKLAGEQLEYAISQFVDGTLSDLDRLVLEEQLRVDDGARRLVEEYRQVTTMLRAADPLPEIDFSRFSASVSAAIAGETLMVGPPVRMWQRRMQTIGIAAGVMLAGMLAFHFVPHTAQTTSPGVAIQIKGPAIETAPAAPSIVVVVGPSDELAKRGETLSLGNESVLTPSPRVVISSVDSPAKSDLRPY